MLEVRSHFNDHFIVTRMLFLFLFNLLVIQWFSFLNQIDVSKVSFNYLHYTVPFPVKYYDSRHS